MKVVLLVIVFVLAATVVWAQVAGTGTRGPMFFRRDFIAGAPTGGGIAPPVCDGTIDTSEGCTLPMLGGL